MVKRIHPRPCKSFLILGANMPMNTLVSTLSAIQVLHNAMRGGGCQLSPKKALRRLQFNVINVTRGVGRSQISREKMLVLRNT